MTMEKLITVWSQYKNLFVLGGIGVAIGVFTLIAVWDIITFEIETQDIQNTTRNYLERL